jgi:hypothetical protein
MISSLFGRAQLALKLGHHAEQKVHDSHQQLSELARGEFEDSKRRRDAGERFWLIFLDCSLATVSAIAVLPGILMIPHPGS